MIENDFDSAGDVLPLRRRLEDAKPLIAVELRPPRRALEGVHAMEAWIDVYHAVRGLSSRDTLVFLTDNAIGTDEEENLTHLVRNIGDDAVRERIVPFLTLKHPLSYCEGYAARLRRHDFPALVVLGGDRHDEIPRCLPHASDLRARLRESQPALLLGGWANPYRDARGQARLLADEAGRLDFVLTQVLSHHDLGAVELFLEELQTLGVELPLFGGVFHYRSARRRTLRALREFIPVPEESLIADFEERGMRAEEVTAATLIALGRLGISRFYLSNLPTGQAMSRLMRIRRLAGLN